MPQMVAAAATFITSSAATIGTTVLGASAATAAGAAVTQAIGGALIGASIGSITAMAKGDDILKGALIGAVAGVGTVGAASLASEAVSPYLTKELSLTPLTESTAMPDFSSSGLLDSGGFDAGASIPSEFGASSLSKAADTGVGMTLPSEAINTVVVNKGTSGLGMMGAGLVSGIGQAGAAMMAPSPEEQAEAGAKADIKVLEKQDELRTKAIEDKMDRKVESQRKIEEYKQSMQPEYSYNPQGQSYRVARGRSPVVNNKELFTHDLKNLQSMVGVRPVTTQGLLSRR